MMKHGFHPFASAELPDQTNAIAQESHSWQRATW
jgi:hypothetical protein